MQQRQVVDTSAWIEWASDTALGECLSQDFPDADHCIVPTIVLLELYKWLDRVRHANEREEILSIAKGCAVHRLDEETAILAAQLARAHGLTMADSVIYATARQQGAELITCDADFANLPGVRLYPKRVHREDRDVAGEPAPPWTRWPTADQLNASPRVS